MSEDMSDDEDYQDDFDLEESLGESSNDGLTYSHSSRNLQRPRQPAQQRGHENFRQNYSLQVKTTGIDGNPNNSDVLAPVTSTKSVTSAFGSSEQGREGTDEMKRSVSFAPRTSSKSVAGSSYVGSSASHRHQIFSSSSGATNNNYSGDTFEDDAASGSAQSKRAYASRSEQTLPSSSSANVTLPQQIMKLRGQVEKFSKSGDKMQLMGSLELLEAALVEHKLQSSKNANSKRAKAKEKQRRAEARRAKHYKEISQLRKDVAECSRFKTENQALRTQLKTAEVRSSAAI